MRSESKYATPRSTPARDVPIGWLTAGICIFLVIAVCSFIYGLWHQTNEAAHQYSKNHSSLTVTYTYDGQMIRWYVMVDPDTGVEYLVNDLGGTTPRLSATNNTLLAPKRNE